MQTDKETIKTPASTKEDTGSAEAAEIHNHAEAGPFRERLPVFIGLGLFLGLLAAEHLFGIKLSKPFALTAYGIAYLLAGYKTLIRAAQSIAHGDVFTEFFLMALATLGAIYIGEYAEGVAVMLFYEIGELFQDLAVERARGNIRALLDVRPETATVIGQDGKEASVATSAVALGATIRLKPGERLGLDGELISERASFNTAALTGESRPDTKSKGEEVLAGMIAEGTSADVRVTRAFGESKLSRILKLVEEASGRKAKTQLFISRFAKIYTPLVVLGAALVVALPYFFVERYVFDEWLYRGLVFLVISCPCALVISIPLGYFGGIGLASRNGILFKGSNFLDVMREVDAVVMDKTGTLTEGVFEVQDVSVADGFERGKLVALAAALEAQSTHPVAKAVVKYAKDVQPTPASNLEEVAGHGMKGMVDGQTVLAGNTKLLKREGVAYPAQVDELVDTVVVVAVEGRYAGYITIADREKADAKDAVAGLRKLNIKTIMLSGDKQAVVDKVAASLGIDEAYGNLLPEDKVTRLETVKQKAKTVAFVGDGVNDAPVVALADVGIAMGGLGSDATIETADVVIQNDEPSKIVQAIKIGRITRGVVMQNITLSLIVKGVVLILGAGGLANLWEAVFADVGVALLAILNAYRIQSKSVA